MFRCLRFALELIAGFIGAVIMISTLLIWRLNAEPATATFLTPYIEATINRILPGTNSTIDHTLLEWNNADLSLALHADTITVKDTAGATIIVVPDIDVEVNLLSFMFGHFLPTALKVDHPQIHLVRYASGEWSLGNPNQTGSDTDVRELWKRIVDSLSQARFTRKLEVNRVVLDVQDMARNTSWSVSIPEVMLERERNNLNGHSRIEVTQKDGVSVVELRYHYDIANHKHEMGLSFDSVTPSQFAGGNPAILGIPQAAMFDLPLTGNVSLSFNDHMVITAGSLQLHADPGQLVAPDVWERPRAIKSFDAEGRYDVKAERQLQGTAAFDFGGTKLSLGVDGVAATQVQKDIDYTATVNLEGMPLDQFGQVWPKAIVPDAREWIISSLSKGQLTHGDVVFKGSLAWKDLENISVDEGRGKFTVAGAKVDYLTGLPPIDGVDATADFDLSQMNIQIKSGTHGDLKILPFVLQIKDLDKDTQTMNIPLNIAGPAVDVMTFLDVPRLGYTKALGLSPRDVTGNVSGTVNLRFPLLKSLAMSDIDLKAHADLMNIASSKLIRHIDITQGNLVLDLDQSSFTIKGTAALNKVPAQVGWQQFFSSKANPVATGTVVMQVNGYQWKSFNVDTLNGTRGPIAVSLNITQPTKRQTLINAVLDAGAADVYVDLIDWRKPFGVPAIMKFNADMKDGQPIIVRNIDLHGPQLNAKGKAVMSEDGSHFTSIDLSTLIAGRNNAEVHYSESKDDDHAIRIDAVGQSFDITNLTRGREPTHTDPRPQRFSIKLNKLYTSDTGFLSNVNGYASHDLEGWSEINVHGRAMGEPWLDISLAPKDDRHVFLMTCDDFGKALHGMGFTASVRNGAMKVYGVSAVDNPRLIEGTIKIGSFVVSDLPLLATLMNATSPFGFVDLFSNTMSFDRLRGNFRWHGDDIDLMQVNLPGSAVGMNIEGKINVSSGAANLRGTIVPFSLVNKVLNYIPLLGDLITGGKGQGVLAVAYSITGTLDNPQTSVNPVSLLTPGFVRNIFFGGSDDLDTPSEGSKTGAEPQ